MSGERGGIKSPKETSKNVQAEQICLTEGQIQRAEARSIDVNQGGIALAVSEAVTVREGGIALAVADAVQMEGGSIGLAIARKISGEATILIDMRAAVLFGLVTGIVITMLKRLVIQRPD